MEVVASLSQGRTAAAQCGLFTYKSVPVIFEPPCIYCYCGTYIVMCSYVCVCWLVLFYAVVYFNIIIQYIWFEGLRWRSG